MSDRARTVLVVLIAALLLSFAAGGSALAFSDVPTSHSFAEAIDDLTARGVVAGFRDGTFRPDAPVTRQQFAKMIVCALGLPTTTADLCRFSDVALSRDDGLYPDHFVAVAAANGITRGYADGTFGPCNNLERTHAVTMVIRALERIYPGALEAPRAGSSFDGDWGDLYGEQRDHATRAFSNGLLDGLDLSGVAKDPRAPMPRGEVAQVLYNMMRLLPEVAEFQSSVQRVDESLKASMLASGSWSAAVPVPLEELRLLRVGFWGFDGRAHAGSIVVHNAWADDLQTVFRKLYDARFPIRSMDLIDDYAASDERSMAADNTSAYNGRYVSGTTVWSMHAYGSAIDINPIENPWVRGDDVRPAAGRSYIDRSLNPPGTIHSWDVVVRAFASIGWKWGGDWKGTKDYQHFSSNGK
ncbi:MAG: M15 family metallopeptidase [bacterium]